MFMMTSRPLWLDQGVERMQPRKKHLQTVFADGYEVEYDKDWAAELDEWAPGEDAFDGDSGGTPSAAKRPDQQSTGPETSDDHSYAFSGYNAPSHHAPGSMGRGSSQDDWTAKKSTAIQVNEGKHKLRELEDVRWASVDAASARWGPPKAGMGMMEQSLSRPPSSQQLSGASSSQSVARLALPCSDGWRDAPAPWDKVDAVVAVDSSEEDEEGVSTEEERIPDDTLLTDIAHAVSAMLPDYLVPFTTESAKIAGEVYSDEKMEARWHNRKACYREPVMNDPEDPWARRGTLGEPDLDASGMQHKRDKRSNEARSVRTKRETVTQAKKGKHKLRDLEDARRHSYYVAPASLAVPAVELADALFNCPTTVTLLVLGFIGAHYDWGSTWAIHRHWEGGCSQSCGCCRAANDEDWPTGCEECVNLWFFRGANREARIRVRMYDGL
jgi:hypothetical protein